MFSAAHTTPPKGKPNPKGGSRPSSLSGKAHRRRPTHDYFNNQLTLQKGGITHGWS